MQERSTMTGNTGSGVSAERLRPLEALREPNHGPDMPVTKDFKELSQCLN